MSFITTASRMWLTRSFSPFTFTAGGSDFIDFTNLESLGLYVHIPFCKKICSFCPYCKQVYDSNLMNDYVDALKKEIQKVGEMNGGNKKRTTSLYFGGGTPALAADRIGEIISELEKYFEITEGVGLELHPDNVTEETLQKLKSAGVSKISIGIQSFNEKYLSVLGRDSFDYSKMFETLKKVPFETVSMDFIFALPDQTFEDLKSDISKAFECGANHVAIYPFIDFSFAKNSVKPMSKNEKHRLLDEITDWCTEKGFRRDSIWTFSNDKTAKYSSMTRENFLGFGCSATTLVRHQFKVNTFSVKEYINCIEKKVLPTSLTINFSERKRMCYWLFWTLYTTRLNPADFERFFGKKLKYKYGVEFEFARLFGFLRKENGVYVLTKKGCFYYHHYENYYTLSYIDKMWGLMRTTPFPDGMKL